MSLLQKGRIMRRGVAPNYALSFDGIDDYIEIPNSASLIMSSEMSLELWIRTLGLEYDIVHFGKEPEDLVYLLYIDDGGCPIFAIWDTDGAQKPVASFVAVNDDQWHHVVGTYSSPDNAAKLYSDGILRNEEAGGENIASSDGALMLAYQRVSNNFFSGSLYRVRLYNRALTLAEVQQNMRSATPVTTGLVLSLPMNEGRGDTVYDKSGENNHGTLLPNYPSNAPTWVRR